MDFGLPSPEALPNELRRLFAHRLAALAAMELGQMRPKQLHIVAQLSHGADSRAGGFNRVALLDGNGGGDAIDAIDLRLVHPIKELPGVRRESLDITPLAFGKKSVKRQGTFPR